MRKMFKEADYAEEDEDYEGLGAVAEVQHAMHEAGVSPECQYLGEESRRLDTRSSVK